MSLKNIITVFLALTSYFGILAADTPKDQPTPQELARQIVSAFQTGRGTDIRPKLAADIPILEKSLKTFPDDSALSQKDVSVGCLYALALKANKQPLKAYELSKEMVKLHPDAPQLQILLATIDVTIQKYQEAITILETLERKAPANLRAEDKSALRFMAGTCFLYRGNHTKAIDILESALASTPKMAPTLTVLGEAYLKTGDLEKASVALDKALAINRGYPKALYYKGIYFEKTGNPEMAKKSFQDGYDNGKRYLGDNGEDYYLMFLICEKIAKNEEGNNYKTEAWRLLFSYEAPWKQR